MDGWVCGRWGGGEDDVGEVADCVVRGERVGEEVLLLKEGGDEESRGEEGGGSEPGVDGLLGSVAHEDGGETVVESGG